MPLTSFNTIINRDINCMIYEFDEDIGFILFSFDFSHSNGTNIHGTGFTIFDTINHFKFKLFKIIEEQTGLITPENFSLEQQQILTTNFESSLICGINIISKHHITFRYNPSDNSFSTCPF
jgi:hypothetical protein